MRGGSSRENACRDISLVAMMAISGGSLIYSGA